MRILFKCEDCLLIGWDEDDVQSYTRCPHCGGEFIFMSQKEIYDYQSEHEPYELPKKSPYGEIENLDSGATESYTPSAGDDLRWLLSDEDNEFNLNN